MNNKKFLEKRFDYQEFQCIDYHKSFRLGIVFGLNGIGCQFQPPIITPMIARIISVLVSHFMKVRSNSSSNLQVTTTSSESRSAYSAQQYSQSPVSRSTRLETEKAYRREFVDYLQELAMLVPELKKLKNPSKGEIMKETVSYIIRMQTLMFVDEGLEYINLTE